MDEVRSPYYSVLLSIVLINIWCHDNETAWRISSQVSRHFISLLLTFIELILYVCAGYPGCEFQIREALAEVVGAKKSELFFDKVSIQVTLIDCFG